MMKRKAVGFYWTLPVPWAGFTALPDDIDAAASVSTTIRYQRTAIRKFAREEGYELVHEAVFLEIEPDRGSELIRQPLAKAETVCREQDAVLLYVDFGMVQGWRSHAPMQAWSERTSIQTLGICPGELWMDGILFDPHGHFHDWREKQEAWSAGKPERAEQARNHGLELRQMGLSYAQVAQHLNDDGIRSLSGKPWTAENLRKFLVPAVKAQQV